jgi:hypothetical protein
MTTRRQSQYANNRYGWSEHHNDLGALRERVSGTERAVANLGDLVANNQRDTAKQIENLQTSLSAQIRDISGSFAASRATNWGTIIAAVGVVVVLGGAVLTPIMSDLGKTAEAVQKLADKAVTRDIYNHDQDGQNSWLASLRDRSRAEEDTLNATRIELARMDGAATERHADYLRAHALLDAHISSVDANLIKRPEIETIVSGLSDRIKSGNESANDRITSVIQSLNELRHDFGANWTIGDTVRQIETRLNALQFAAPLPAPPPAPPK